MKTAKQVLESTPLTSQKYLVTMEMIESAMKEYAKLKCAEQRELCAEKANRDNRQFVLDALKPVFD